MHIVEPLKFAIGIVSLLIGIVMLVRAHGTRGFNQSRQIGTILLIAGIAFVGVGFGFSVRNLF